MRDTGYCYERDNGRPPGLQKKHHHDCDQRDGFKQRVLNRANRFVNKDRGVIDHSVVHAGWKALFERIHSPPHGLSRRERIAAGKLINSESGCRLSIEVARHCVGFGPEIDGADFAKANHFTLLAALNNNAREFGRIHQAPLGVDDNLKLRSLGSGLLANDAGGDLLVLLLDRLHHVARREIKSGKFVRIEPDPHRIFGAEDRDAAHAIDARERVLDLKEGVVVEIKLVARIVRRDQVDGHDHRGRLLVYRNARATDFLRKHRKGEIHSILHQYLRGIQVGAEFESDR